MNSAGSTRVRVEGGKESWVTLLTALILCGEDCRPFAHLFSQLFRLLFTSTPFQSKESSANCWRQIFYTGNLLFNSNVVFE